MALSINRLIRASVNLSPLAAQFANLNAALFLGATDVIDVSERWRSYTDLAGVAADFSATDPEYKAAALYFGQTPRPTQLYIGRWAKTATAGLLRGGALSASEQAMSNWTAISSGTLTLTVDGTTKSLSSLDFHLATNLNGVAAIIDAALTGASVKWDGSRFVIESATTGTSSTVGYATAGTIKDMLKLTSAEAQRKVDGIAAEEPDAAAALFDDRFGYRWYALMLADTGLTDDQHTAVAAYIQATQHTYAITSTDATLLDAGTTTDLASVLSAADYTRSFVQYSENPYAAAAFLGRALTVNFNGSNTTLTMMYKVEPGIAPETLTNTQADALQGKRANVYVNYDNSTAILQYGTMAGPAYWDEIHGLDWLANRIQTDWYNQLYTSPTKVPQTDAGVHQLVTLAQNACAQGVANGLIAPGLWNSAGFGELAQGDTLHEGYYVWAQPVALQAQADRDARKAPPIQIAVKLAGAVHTADVLIQVNR